MNKLRGQCINVVPTRISTYSCSSRHMNATTTAYISMRHFFLDACNQDWK